MKAEPKVILALRSCGDGLTITALPQPPTTHGDQWFDVAIETRAHPFNGTVTTILTGEDLLLFRDGVEGLAPPGEVTLGGERAVGLRMHVEKQVGGKFRYPPTGNARYQAGPSGTATV